MTLNIPTQPMPDKLAEACSWLHAAERHDDSTLEDRLTAGDLLDDLTDVEPPYPPINRSRPPAPFGEAAGHAIAALQEALNSNLPIPDRLRIATAVGMLRQAVK